VPLLKIKNLPLIKNSKTNRRLVEIFSFTLRSEYDFRHYYEYDYEYDYDFEYDFEYGSQYELNFLYRKVWK